MKRFVFLTALLFALVARPAFATSIYLVTGNTSFTVNWLYTATNPDLSATATFTISNYTTSGFDLKIDGIANTTATSPDIFARLSSFGFGMTPDATSHSGVDNGTVYQFGFSNFPGGFGSVDVCAFSGNNCAGGGNNGLLPGQTTNDMNIHFDGPFTNGVTFSDFGIKIQTNAGSYEFGGCITDCGSTFNDQAAVPEPASMVLLGTGLVLGAARLRRSRRQAQ